jgi:hypothetical protein
VESPALMDSVSSDLISQAGAGDAAGALRLVAGATVSDGKYAVVRGLPDRYVNTQMNSVRLPSADSDKRAVQLDQFPSGVIQSIQVSKTFTPDQQGDASGGAVNVVLKGIPDSRIVDFKAGTSYNRQVTGRGDFLTYQDGGINFLGIDTERHKLPWDAVFSGPVGVIERPSPDVYSFSIDAGGKSSEFLGFKTGGFMNIYYNRDATSYKKGTNESWWILSPGAPMTPRYDQGSPDYGPPVSNDFRTSLFDASESTAELQWGGLLTVGIESDTQRLTMVAMYTRVTQDTATLYEDTKGKSYYFPGSSPDDPYCDANINQDAAPYIRTETLEYTERSTTTFQINGDHKLPISKIGFDHSFAILPPEFDWTVALSGSEFYQPDKRLFGSRWNAPVFSAGLGEIKPAQYLEYKPAANVNLGNLQMIWKDITETSDQFFWNAKLPFQQWTGDTGYFKAGWFHDRVDRQYTQQSFSNIRDLSAPAPTFYGRWQDFWSVQFQYQENPISASNIDTDYYGEQEIQAWYYMLDVPLWSAFKVVFGTRFERTDLTIACSPESNVFWIPPGGDKDVLMKPGDGNVMFAQTNRLPAYGFQFTPIKEVSFRGSYSQTIARQTFKELAPIQQMEYLGDDIFVGNPTLQISTVKNYDLRLDYTPYSGSLFSLSWFKKDIKGPIEYVQKLESGHSYFYTTPLNYPKGGIRGIEFEARSDMGHFWKILNGLTLGANGTFIESWVELPYEEMTKLMAPKFSVWMPSRDMMNAPDHLYNFYLTYDLKKIGGRFGVFYTIKGDTLVVGAGPAKDGYIPNVYAKEYGSLNMTYSQKVNDWCNVGLQAKNMTNPSIQEVYRADTLFADVVKTSYRKGIDWSANVTLKW